MSAQKYEDRGWKIEDGGDRKRPPAAIRRHLPSSIFHPRFLLLAITLAAGCSTSRREEPLSGPLPLSDPKLVAGRQVFMGNCYECHPGGSAGLGPSLNDKPLPAFAIRTQVRKGFGAMPAFDDSRIPNWDLDNLVAYLQMLRSHKPG
jgi:mono/diheme cytochrome c family protein